MRRGPEAGGSELRASSADPGSASNQKLQHQARALAGDAPALEAQQHVELVSRTDLHLLEVAPHLLAILFEDFRCVVQATLRTRDCGLDQSLRCLQEGAASRFHIMYAGQTEEGQLVVAPDALAENILGGEIRV